MREGCIYLDHAATTKLRPEVRGAMASYLKERFGNPSAFYQLGRESRQAVEYARKQTASVIGAEKDEIYFTAGGTESDNWALRGIMKFHEKKGKHLIISSIEHHAIIHTADALEKEGYEVTRLSVDKDGMITLDELERAIRADTVLVSVMTANNEVGTIEPISQIGRIAHKNHVLFHTDAVQGYGKIPIRVREMEIDLLSASAHKIGGPKGCGLLYIRKNVEIEPILYGGHQENKLRAGTENVAGIVGFGKAAELCEKEMSFQFRKQKWLRNYLIRRLMTEVPDCVLNGSYTMRLPSNVNISFPGIEAGELLVLLDGENICASAGSACTTGQNAPSHVLTAMGISEKLAHGTLRLTLGNENTKEEIDFAADQIARFVKELRKIS